MHFTTTKGLDMVPSLHLLVMGIRNTCTCIISHKTHSFNQNDFKKDTHAGFILNRKLNMIIKYFIYAIFILPRNVHV